MKVKKIITNIVTMYYVKEMVFVTPCRKLLTRLCVYVSIFAISLTIFWMPQLLANRNYFLSLKQNRFPTDLKYIFMWTPSHLTKKLTLLRETKMPEGQSIFIKQRCQFINCFITYDKDLLRENHQNLDAVVFNVRDIIKYPPAYFNLTRSLDQKFIFHSMDSSEKYPVCNTYFDNFFNLTWTYKLNSDIPQPLLNIFNTKNELVGPKLNIKWIENMTRNDNFKRKNFNKTKAVAWLVPSCRTKVKYQDFLKELSDELKGYKHSVDLYGPCGNKKCPAGSKSKCHKMIEKTYFFQLVLEDSLAEDYVSERMARAMSHIIIPIILGVSDFKRFLPPGSYINAQSFDIKKLGAVIDYLIQYPNTYYYFFDWKNHYYYTVRPKSEICGLCAKLNDNNTATNNLVIYKNFRKWWNYDYWDACHQMNMDSMLFKTD